MLKLVFKKEFKAACTQRERSLKCRSSGVKRNPLDERCKGLTLVSLQSFPFEAHRLIARYEDACACVTLTSWRVRVKERKSERERKRSKVFSQICLRKKERSEVFSYSISAFLSCYAWKCDPYAPLNLCYRSCQRLSTQTEYGCFSPCHYLKNKLTPLTSSWFPAKPLMGWHSLSPCSTMVLPLIHGLMGKRYFCKSVWWNCHLALAFRPLFNHSMTGCPLNNLQAHIQCFLSSYWHKPPTPFDLNPLCMCTVTSVVWLQAHFSHYSISGDRAGNKIWRK